MIVDCPESDEENHRGLEWVGRLAGRTLQRLEIFHVQVSKHGTPFPPTCSLPHLISLALGRGTCIWASVILPTTSSRLKSFSLQNVQASYAVRISEMLEALRSAPGLEQLRVDEVEWTPSDAKEDIPPPVNLPNLVSLSLTAVGDIFGFIQPLQMPRLTELVVGDILDDLGPVFTEFAQKTSTIQRLTTGFWEEEYMAQSENGFITLLEKQTTLRSLAVGQASIDRILVQHLMKSADGSDDWLCPELVSLELPIRLVSPEAVRAMVESRSAAGMQLDSLTLVGKVESCWDREGLSQHVGRLKIEEVEEVGQ